MTKKDGQWKAYVGSGLVIVGSAMAGWGFGKRDSKCAILGTFIMGIGTLCVVDNHADVINNNAKGMDKMFNVLKEHEDRIRNMENK